MPQRMRVTPTGRQRLYLTRHMWADEGKDEVWIEDANVEAARTLGYVEDIGAESATPAPKRRGRPPKAAPPLEEKTVPELRDMAEKKGVELPSGYVKKDELVEMVQGADPGDEDRDKGKGQV